MNAILEQINSAGFVFVKFALPMLIQSAVLIVVLLLVDLLLRKKVRAVFRYWLWMLILIKLVLPTSLSSPVSLGSWFGDKLTTVKFSEMSIPTKLVNLPQMIEVETAAATGISSSDVKPIVTPQPDAKPIVAKAAALPVAVSAPLTWQSIVFLVWVAVVTTMGLLLLQRAIFVTGLVSQAQNPTQLMSDAFNFCCRQMGIRSKVGLKVSANTASPAVCGLFRPVVLVPQNLAPTLGSSHLRPVLLHELAHIRRGDLWINLVQTILQIFYFYNPLLWLANVVIRRIREQAVDETVQVAMGANAPQYPQVLVDVAKLAFNRPVLSLRLIGVVESKSALKSRIERMLNHPIPKTAKLGILGLAAVIVIGFMFLPMAKAAKPEKSSQNPIGIWQSVDFVKNIEDFTPGEKNWPEELYLKNVKFMKNGKTSSFFTWNKNLICHNDGRTKAAYQIKEIDGSRYLFLPWLSGDVTIRGQKPKYYVMKEVKDNKENALDFTVALGRNVIVDEGVGFNGFLVGDANCTGEFIKSTLGEPDGENKDEKEGWWLDYRKKYGLDFWLNLQKDTLREIRLNKGFKGKLSSGISMSSTKQDVFDTYGKPIREEVVENLHQRYDNQVLLFREPAWVYRWRKPNIAKIHYNEKGLLFWFDGDTINQIVISRRKSNQPQSEGKKQQPTDINAKKREIADKLEALYKQRENLQKELDMAENAMDDVRNRYQIYDLEENPHPIAERLNRLQKEQDDCTLEISQVKARVENLKTGAHTEQDQKYLKDTKNLLAELQAKFDALEKMRTEAEVRKKDLDLARIQYNQREAIKVERLQKLNELKSQIEKLKLMYENPEAFDTQTEVEDKSKAAAGTIDVAIENFKINPYPDGGLYTVIAAIRNKGSQEAPPFRLNFYRGNPANNLDLHGKPQTGSNGAGPIKPGDVWNESSTPFALKEGLNEIAVVLDTGRNIAESDQTNNRAFMRLIVKDGYIKENSVSYSPQQKTENLKSEKTDGQPEQIARKEPVLRVYKVNRSVADFPKKEDFSTPEAAYTAINRVSAGGEDSDWIRVSTKKLAEKFAGQKNKGGKNVDSEWAKVLLNATILEVRILNENRAMVIAELPQRLSSKLVSNPIDVRHLEIEDGRWLNIGNDRCATIEQARAKFSD